MRALVPRDSKDLLDPLRPLNQNKSQCVSVYETVLRRLLPHRNTASDNRVIHVVNLAVTMTDSTEVDLVAPSLANARRGGRQCPWQPWVPLP